MSPLLDQIALASLLLAVGAVIGLSIAAPVARMLDRREWARRLREYDALQNARALADEIERRRWRDANDRRRAT